MPRNVLSWQHFLICLQNQWINQDTPFSGYIESKCNPVRQFEGLRYSAVSDDVVVADDDGAGFHDQHQNDAKSAVVAPF